MSDISNMTNEELLKQYEIYEDLIYKNQCYNTNDLYYFYELEYEFDRRSE